MTLTQMIATLEALKARHGDLSVKVTDGTGFFGFAVTAEEVDGLKFVQLDTTATDDE